MGQECSGPVYAFSGPREKVEVERDIIFGKVIDAAVWEHFILQSHTEYKTYAKV